MNFLEQILYDLIFYFSLLNSKSGFFLNVYRISSINFDCLLNIEETAVKNVEIDAIIKNNADNNAVGRYGETLPVL